MLTLFATVKLLPFVFASHCKDASFFFLPPWWKYLDADHNANTGQCDINFQFPGDIWAVALAITDMLLRIGGFIAVIMIIVAGVSYIMSSGNAEKTAAAKGRIINSFIGLGIVMVAAAAVTFVGNNLIK